MLTVAEIVAAAEHLSPLQLAELREALDRLDPCRRTLRLEDEGVVYRRVRLGDGEFLDLLRRSLAIEEDYGFVMDLLLARRRAGTALGFPEVYLALTDLAGPSGEYFDDWKGSFSFPFTLEVVKGRRRVPYLFEVRNHRSCLEFARNFSKTLGSGAAAQELNQDPG
jgi:hypothetical protein